MHGSLFLCCDFHSVPLHSEGQTQGRHLLMMSALIFFLASPWPLRIISAVYQVCPIKRDQAVGEVNWGGFGGVGGVGLRSNGEKRRG